jgi:hypothetical protein
MHIQVNTSNGVANNEALERWATEYLSSHLAHFRQDVTSLEVQLSDQNHGTKGGAADMRCKLEARVAGRPPVVASHDAADQDLAFRGATAKLVHALEHTLGKLDRKEHRERDTIRKDIA